MRRDARRDSRRDEMREDGENLWKVVPSFITVQVFRSTLPIHGSLNELISVKVLAVYSVIYKGSKKATSLAQTMALIPTKV